MESDERVSAIRANQDDLCQIVAQLRERIANLEVMTIALAGTHPDGMTLLKVLRDVMALPEDAELTDDLRAHHARETDRIISLWRAVLAPRSECSRAVH
jgi:hypothetical protein